VRGKGRNDIRAPFVVQSGAPAAPATYHPASLSSSRRIDSPITLVPTLAVAGPITSAVRSPLANTLVQACSISAASSSIAKE